MAKNNNLTDFLVDVANAIRAKKGTTAKINPQDFSSEIASIESGGGSAAPSLAMPNDVNFIDYDGVILHSYSAGEFASLSALPSLPMHDGLICQGWNYTLEDAKSYVAEYGMLDIGAMYITDDGNTRLYIRIAEEGRMTVPLCFSQSEVNGVIVNWGDGSGDERPVGTGMKQLTHTYANKGDYVITLQTVTGELHLGSNGSNICVMGSTANNGRVYCNMLQKVELGNVDTLKAYAFSNCYSLKSITIPNSTTVSKYAFNNCHSLRSITVPLDGQDTLFEGTFYTCYSLTRASIPYAVAYLEKYLFQNCASLKRLSFPPQCQSISVSCCQYCYSLEEVCMSQESKSVGSSAFQYCKSLKRISLPKTTFTTLATNAFQYCESLVYFFIPKNVTTIPNSVFANCYGMAVYDFTQHTSVPTLSSTNAFNSIPSDCKIKVPASLLDSWKAATNWSTYASKIVAG